MAQHLHLALSLGGYLGGLLVLSGYALTSSGRLRPASPTAQAVNTTGALLLVASSIAVAAWPSVGVNVAWVVIGVAAAWRARAGATTAAAADLDAVPAPRSAGSAAVDVWPGDWDAAAEHLAAGTAPTHPAPRPDAPPPAADTAAQVPPTAPLPTVRPGRPRER